MLCLCVLPSAFAVSYGEDIKKTAFYLKGVTVNKTVANIDRYVESVIEYKFYYYQRGLTKTWSDKKGDCTDKAMLKCEMLKTLKVPCREVHGYVKIGEEYKTKHDWIEWKDGKNWVSDECKYWDYCKKTGNEIW
jgi:transglutaminase-like putative cysteine protease